MMDMTPDTYKETPPRTKRRHGLLIFVLVLVVLLGGLALWRVLTPEVGLPPVPQQPVQVMTATARIEPISVSTTLTGKVTAANEAVIIAAGAGTVNRINVAVGDHVKKGQRLFSLDATQVQGSMAQAQVARDMALEGVETARVNLERMQSLYDSAAISASQLEQAQNALSLTQNQLRQAEASLNSASNSMSLLNFDAPISGYITEINIKEGMYPNPSQAAMAIADLSELEIKASVSEYLIGHLQEGAPVSFKITSLSEEPFNGSVKTVPLAPAVGSLTYPITVAVDSAHSETGIKPGMFAELSLPSQQKEAALTIPTAALFTRGGQTLVAVLDDNDIPSFAEVETGLNNGKMVEIISGLSEGAAVVTKGQHYIVEGEAVTRLAE